MGVISAVRERQNVIHLTSLRQEQMGSKVSILCDEAEQIEGKDLES